MQGNYERALEELNKAVTLSDQYHHYYHYQGSYQYTLLAECHAYLDELGEALAAYKKAVFQDHTNPRALMGLKAVENNQPLPLGLPEYTRMVEYDSDLSHYIFLPGERPLKPEKTHTAPEENNASSLYDAAIHAINKKDTDKAREYFILTLKLNPEHSKAAFGLGRIAFEKHAYRDALVWIKKACAMLSEEHDAYHWTSSFHRLWRGEVYEAMGDADMAIADYSKAIDLQGKNTDAYLARAKAYLAKGNAAAAEADMRKVRG